MAKPVSEEELQLKKRARRRLIGAIALVAGVAAVLPMVLDTEPKSGPQEINIQIPSPEPKGAVVSKVTPLVSRADKTAQAKSDAKAPESAAVEKPDARAPDSATAQKPDAKTSEKALAEKSDYKVPAKTAKAESADKVVAKAPDNPNDTALSRAPRITQEKASAKTPDKAAEKAPEKAAAKVTPKAPEKTAEKAPERIAEKAPAKAPAPKAGPGAFFIQVIALSEAEKAKQVQQQIAGSGVRAYTEVVTSGTGQVTRVRAGPFATREEADKAQAKLQGIGLEGKVAAY
jgi:DedD protein